MTDQPLPDGKLAPELLAPLLPATARGVALGAAVGEDAAVVAVDGVTDRQLVLTADPITLAGGDLGRYAVAVNCNDIIAMGGEPRYFLATVLLPRGTGAGRLRALFAELQRAVDAAGVAWIGGHTEVTPAVTTAVVSGCAVGVLAGAPWSTAGAQPGDRVLMTKWVALEGTTLLAREHERASQLLGSHHRSAVAWLEQPGLGLHAEGRALRGLALSAAHDPTEGGIAQGLHELADCSQVAIELDAAVIPVRTETRLLCAGLGIDPLGLLASGTLLFTAAPAVADQATAALRAADIDVTTIGQVRAGAGVTLIDNGNRRPLAAFPQDEITRL